MIEAKDPVAATLVVQPGQGPLRGADRLQPEQLVRVCGADVLRRIGARGINADDDLKLKQMHELLQGHLARRKIEPGVLDYKTVEKAAGQAVRQKVLIRQGIDRDIAKRIVKEVKDGKFKVQVTVQGNELRVSGKKRDDLQAVIQHVKGLSVELPLQYVNFRD